MTRRNYKEASDQRKVIKWADVWFAENYPEYLIRQRKTVRVLDGPNINTFKLVAPLYHIENEGKGSAKKGHRRNQQGRKSGVPDLDLPIPRGGYVGLRIEMKQKKNSGDTDSNANQLSWLKFLAKVGHRVKICYSSNEAIETIIEYMKGE